ncbi:Endonuclease III [hydrothermal vent metagenome]|uniref:Endonuclease III n=1 Tax=hydrothermal vent metagenome TaxID=652676 RepID=A0A3B1C5X9_9ZZZZ
MDINTKKILNVNKNLIKHFGIPPRNKELPDSVDMLIATILSQNTNDNNSFKAYQNLKRKYNSWDELLKVRRTTIEKEIKVAGLGLQKSKAIKNFITNLYKEKKKISLDHIVELENSAAISELTKFKGIGIKTASCVLLFAEGRNVCPVDTHVHRTVNRIGIVKASTPDKTFFKLNDNFPPKIAHQFHTNLIRLGREICKPKNPSCGICPLLELCEFEEKNLSKKEKGNERSFMLLDSV